MTATRSDIEETVGEPSNHDTQPKEAHINAVKRVLRYLEDICDVKPSCHITSKLHGAQTQTGQMTWTIGDLPQAMCSF